MQLPIDLVIPVLRAAFRGHSAVVLSADPGAGKTTRVPLALLGEPWLIDRKIIMLEPRRLAAQRAAAYMAQVLGENPGETVGYRIRGETRIGTRTRIEVVTEGILTRMLQSDATLPDTGLVIFDEFHERSIHADLGLALTLDVRQHLRPELRILVMSATLDGIAVSTLLGSVPIIASEGRTFPVITHYLRHTTDGPVEPPVASTILRALSNNEGDVLVFLPGQREIRRVESLLREDGLPPGVVVHTLYGDAPPGQQQAALMPPPPGKRKVILSTSVAETSLTIDGVRIVIDSGLARGPRFVPRRGMSGLVTTPVSQASADQRRGRAGRQQSGVCYRLWTETQHGHLPKFAPPEITVADLAPFALELARWGTPDAGGLRFLDPPPPPHLAQARDLLTRLGAIESSGKLTDHGRAMADLSVHPRFAHMLIRGRHLGLGALACDVAAMLEERDLLRGDSGADIDLHSRWYTLHHGGGGDRFARERVNAQAKRLRGMLGVEAGQTRADRIGVLLALAYPERVGKRRDEQSSRYQFSGGAGGILPKGSLLSREPYIAAGDVDGMGSEVKIFLASPITENEIREAFGDQLTTSDDIRWDERLETVVSRRVTRFGAIDLSESPLPQSGEPVRSAMIVGIRGLGLEALPWSKDALSLRSRSEWLRERKLVGDGWPDLGDRNILETLEEWLGPYLDGITKRQQLARLDIGAIIRARFTSRQLRELDRLAPTHLTVPTGSRIPLEYSPCSRPILAVRLQEMFGQTETPSVGGGREPVVLHLLSPARRPLAVTQDLPSFWRNAYPDVRKDMRGRYPKHHWPQNPMEAKPTKRVKGR